MKRRKTFSIITLGCKVNQYDSQVIREQFKASGFLEVDFIKTASIYIINTCTVTHKADRQARALIYRIVRKNPKAQIIITGCFAQDRPDELAGIDGVDLVVGNDKKFKILELLNIKPNTSQFSSCLGKVNTFDNHTRAFVKIQDGCNNFCSYCKVPYVRGRSRSKEPKLVRQEILQILKQGFKEIVLCGVCLGDYGKDLVPKTSLCHLVKDLISIEQNFRIRLSSIEPKDISSELIDSIATSKKICRHLHIPFQSGDSKTLELMNRNSKVEDYLDLVGTIRKNIAGIAITTDILIGFPKEEEQNFKNTIDFLKKIKPSRMHIFTFSPRHGTEAFRLQRQRPDPLIVKKRYNILSDLAKEFSFNFRNLFLNKVLEVLVESKNYTQGSLRGYTDNYILTKFTDKKGDSFINNIIPLKIIRVEKDHTFAEVSRAS